MTRVLPLVLARPPAIPGIIVSRLNLTLQLDALAGVLTGSYTFPDAPGVPAQALDLDDEDLATVQGWVPPIQAADVSGGFYTVQTGGLTVGYVGQVSELTLAIDDQRFYLEYTLQTTAGAVVVNTQHRIYITPPPSIYASVIAYAQALLAEARTDEGLAPVLYSTPPQLYTAAWIP